MTSHRKKKLPIIHDRREREAGNMLRVEQIDLEFSNGARRTYSRMKPRGLGAVIIVPMLDAETVLLAREYAAGLHHYEIGLPKGRLEKGESIIEAAQREMKEEIGYGAHRLERQDLPAWHEAAALLRPGRGQPRLCRTRCPSAGNARQCGAAVRRDCRLIGMPGREVS